MTNLHDCARPCHSAFLAAGIVLMAAAPASASAQSSTAATAAVAHPFLQMLFVQRDSLAAYRRFAAPDFIQHDPDIGDGVAGFEAFVAARQAKGLASSSSWVNVIDNVVIDGDLFAVHQHTFMGPEDRGRVIVNLWRVANGRIVEHWDSIQPTPETMLNTNTMWCGKGNDYASAKALGETLSHPTCGGPNPAASREQSLAVIDAYTKELRAHNVSDATAHWFAPDYRQHSPNIADGVAGAIAYLTAEHGKSAAQKPAGTPPRIIAQGDYVIHHHHTFHPGEVLGMAQFDIFRITNGKMSEHWDIKQPVREKTVSGHDMW